MGSAATKKKPRLAPLIKRYVDEEATMLVCRSQIGIDVKILDVRISYGRTEFLVEPVFGSGAAWVEQTRVHV